jgi:hypothetical protein
MACYAPRATSVLRVKKGQRHLPCKNTQLISTSTQQYAPKEDIALAIQTSLNPCVLEHPLSLDTFHSYVRRPLGPKLWISWSV